MKKSKKIILCSEIALISMASFGCVYGPPPDEDLFESSSDSVSVTENIKATDYDPYYDDIQSEYEAPLVEEMTKQTTTESADEEYNPETEEVQDVYGPPPDMD